MKKSYLLRKAHISVIDSRFPKYSCSDSWQDSEIVPFSTASSNVCINLSSNWAIAPCKKTETIMSTSRLILSLNLTHTTAPLAIFPEIYR